MALSATPRSAEEARSSATPQPSVWCTTRVPNRQEPLSGASAAPRANRVRTISVFPPGAPAADRHAGVGRLQHDADPAGVQLLHQEVGQVLRHALLDLRPARERLDRAGQLAQAGDPAVGQVGDVSLAKKGQQMMFTIMRQVSADQEGWVGLTSETVHRERFFPTGLDSLHGENLDELGFDQCRAMILLK